MNEFWALAIFPAIFYFSYKLIREGAKYIPFVALSVSGLMLSHNPILMIFAPVLVIWCLFWIFKLNRLNRLVSLGLSAFWALGLAAFLLSRFFLKPNLFPSGR